MNDTAFEYMVRAIERIESDQLSGSHIEGIFGRVASEFEKRVRRYLRAALATCDLDYEKDLRKTISGHAFNRPTLGQCHATLREAASKSPSMAAICTPAGWALADFLTAIAEVNQAWVEVKHGNDVDPSLLLSRMKLLRTISPVIGEAVK